MRSMTGFGQASAESPRFRFQVTLRAVNHRFLDVALRLKDEYRAVEAPLRELLAGRLERGRIDATVEVEPIAAAAVEASIDARTVAALHAACHTLAEQGLIAAELTFGDLLRLPQVVRIEASGPAWSEEDQGILLDTVGRALDQVTAARLAEGEKLAAALDQRLAALDRVVAELTERAAGQSEAIAATLRRRLDELLAGAAIDEQRLAQEVAFLAERSDVGEELDRLRSHLDHFRNWAGNDGGVGKRLDFLAQEILRELNTVASKCRDGEMTHRVLEGKALCEQLREQVQNVE